MLIVVGCSRAPALPPTSTSPPLASVLTLYNWEDGMPQSVLDAFTEAYGVAINYVPYVSYEEMERSLKAGEVYDVVFTNNIFIGESMGNEMLAELNLDNIPNISELAVDFRALGFDPGNRYSIPYTWGTTGLLVRTDLFPHTVTTWNDLWAAEPGRAGIWDDSRTLIGLALRSLGYSANTDDPAELEAALAHLLELKQRAVFLESFDPWTSAPALDSGQVTIAFGWAFDALAGRDLNPAIEYVIPDDGTLLWLENMVVPANSPNQYTAEVFINFMLRPDIAGNYANQMYYAVSVEAADEFIDPAIRGDPAVYPTNEQLDNAELLMPLPADVSALYADVWQRFMAAGS
jgi:spermidine/putrescine transport system substrate-binding protein